MKRIVALLFGCLAGLAGPAGACVDPGGIGGTGIDGGGIGGTGLRVETDVGILGVVSAFASICVNGVEVHYDAATSVSLNGEPVSPAQLALGQVVVVRATGSGMQARARSIDIVASAVGPVASVDAASGILQIQGRAVRVQPATVIGEGVGSMSDLRAGQMLRVSGLAAADGSLVATRIDAAPDAKPVLVARAPDLGPGRFVVQGYVSDVEPEGVRVGGIAFQASPDIRRELQRDRLVRMVGRSEGERRIVERADLLARPLDIRPERRVQPERRVRDGEDRRGGRSGRGADRGDRGDRVDRPQRDDRPERIDRSGSNSGRR